MTRKIQAKHIDTYSLVKIVNGLAALPLVGVNTVWATPNVVNLSQVQGFLWNFPPKVGQAKLRNLISRGYIFGCACGCRGDFHLSPLGIQLLVNPSEIDKPPAFVPKLAAKLELGDYVRFPGQSRLRPVISADTYQSASGLWVTKITGPNGILRETDPGNVIEVYSK